MSDSRNHKTINRLLIAEGVLMSDRRVSDDHYRLRLIFGIAALGIFLAFAGFGIAVWAFHGTDKPGEVIPAILGPLTTVIGTLAGYVAGQQAGASGKEKAEAQADKAQQQATDATKDATDAKTREAVLRGAASPDILEQAKAKYPGLFQ